MRSRYFLALLVFVAIYCAYSLHSVSTRDPTSLFFDPRTGYASPYSTLRKEHAESFVLAAGNYTQSIDVPANQRRLCVGIPSIARKGARYLRAAVGSLLEGLSPEERSEIFFIVFIPHSKPALHPAYTEHWLENLTDEILVYDVDEVQLEHIKLIEAEGGVYREKGLYDYSYLMRECYKKETPYIAIFEDDIVAMDGWYHRTMAGVEEAETLSALKKASPDFLYLRLFYTEEYLGWNAEYWKTYLFYSALFTAMTAGAVVAWRAFSPAAKRLIPDRKTVLFTVPASAVFILTIFAIGRMTVFPLPAGVNEMSKFGCCSQGFVFPRQKAMSLVNWFESKRYGFVDALTEDYANQYGELRWALTPAVVQHVGRKSSKIDDYGPDSKYGLSVAEKIWNFGFEKYKVDELRREHDVVRQKGQSI